MVSYEYDLEKDRMLELIKKHNAETVMLHLPDGLKNKAADIQHHITSNLNNVNVLIWAGSNFGACDLPVDVERAGVDLILHFGHSPWLS